MQQFRTNKTKAKPGAEASGDEHHLLSLEPGKRIASVFYVVVERLLLFMTILIGILSPLFWLCYVFGRVFLVVECFLNLAHLPSEAFKTVNWPGYVPHIA